MNRISIKIAAIICFTIIGFISFNITISAREATSVKSNSVCFDKYDLHFFGHATSSTPHSVIRLDNNGEILLACQMGKTIEQMKVGGIQVTQSQIRLLEDWRLLKKEDNTFKTNFPILDSTKTEYLRKITKEAALRIGPELTGVVYALKEVLEFEGHGENTYTILFSYVLDDLVWDELEEARRIMERKITIEKPFWAGFLWALYPPRAFSCGTNSSVDQGIGLYLNWSKKGGKLIFSVYSNPEAYTYLFQNIVKYGKVKNKKAITFFKPYNIFDSAGNLTIPIVVEDTSNNIYKLSKILAQKVAKQVINTLNIIDLKSELSIKDSGKIIIVVYHELMWDLLDYFESQGVIQKPVIFANPEKAGLKDVADLIFIVKQKNQK
ncbi:hypothetical protein KAW18_06970 [candidate division WOR-3 bacterium]|nr:hypothetical protein [candidate division WOR-3 bacterium]